MMIVWGIPFCLFAVTGSIAASAAPDTSALRPMPAPFQPGEKFVYSVEYGFIAAGEAALSVVGIDTVRGIPCYNVRSRAQSNPTFSTFFKVDDRVDSFIDIYRQRSLRFVKHLREGKYRKDLEMEFDPGKPLAYYPDGDTLETYPHTQDILSSLYYLRTKDLEVGRTIMIPHHDNKKNYPLEVKVLRRERVSVPAGKFTCYVVEPLLKDVGIFKAKGKIQIWITADERRMPVLVKTSVLVGSVSAKLESYETGRPVDFESFIITAKDSIRVDQPANGPGSFPEEAETGGGDHDVPPQDSGSRETRDLPHGQEEEPGPRR